MLFFTQCFGAVLDLIHLRFQHYKAKRVFSAAGQLVCVVNPTHNLKYVSSRRAVTQSSPEQGSFHPHHLSHHHCHHRHHQHLRHHAHPHHLHHQEAGLHATPVTPCLCMCPLFSCQWEGHLEVVVPHLRQIHRVDILQGAEIVFLATDMHLPAPADWIIMHSCLGHHFLLVLRKQERHEGHPQFFATMMLIGTPTQADCFTYRLELNRNHRRLKWEATPRSVLECVDSVITDGDCLVLNTSLAQLFSDNGSLAIGIAITATEVRPSEAEM
ncbi:seven in absentia homolog 3 [Pongo abelii]|uniref:seven in absentia homolog 3 n=1 Tax=Pongo abelii TaxID=9601 RepID=UPI0023E7EB92|nr:seven in absentia homolog 3 [Pongo abelii]